jgi:hypothetical protein
VSTNTPKKKPIGLIVGIVALVLFVCCGGVGTLAFIVVNRAVDGADKAAPHEAGPGLPSGSKGKAVRFEIEGTGRLLSLTYTDAKAGGAKTISDVQLPWRLDTPCCEEFDYALVGALQGDTKGPVTCRILVDGKEVVANTDPTLVDCRWVP